MCFFFPNLNLGRRFEYMTVKRSQLLEVLQKIYKDGTLREVVDDSADPLKNKFLGFSKETALNYAYSLGEILDSEGLREVYDEIDDDDDGIITAFIMKKFDLPIGSNGNAQLQYIKILINKYFKDVQK